jgi:cyclophilin family peptidyl-prolyl cis-trans isomerase
MISLHRLAAARTAAAALATVVLVAACSISPGASTSHTPVVSSFPAVTAPPSGAAPSAGGSQAAGNGSCPTTGPQPMAGGEKKVVTIDTAKGPIEITVEADLGPLAAENFVDLAACGFYDGTVFHRVVPGFVIQGGDPTGTGSGGPGYEFKDDPVSTPYTRGTVAMANAGPNTNGSQFFIVLADAGLPPSYSVFGHVTKGMEAVDAIAAAANGVENPASPIKMDKVTVAP